MTESPLPPDLHFVVFAWGVMIVCLVGMLSVSLFSGCRLNAELVNPRQTQPPAVTQRITLPRTDQGDSQ